MKAFIHVDESGPFDEKMTGVTSSVVGGVCSVFPPSEWVNIHHGHLAMWNASQKSSFIFPKHYHCGPLLSRKLICPARVSDRDLRLFVESVFNNVLGHSIFGFAAKNRGKRFEYSPQATYVMNLVAALRCAFENLHSAKHGEIEQVTVVIAQRTIDETVKANAGSRYMSSLLSYVNDQLLVGEGPGVTLARRLTDERALIFESGVGDRDAGLIAADFICCLFRGGIKVPPGSAMHVCQPNQEMLLGDYRRFHERLANELLQNRYYGSCLEFLCRYFPLAHGTPDTGILIQQLDAESDPGVLEREVPALLAVIHQLAKNRTEAPHLLACAINVAEKLIALAERRTADLPAGSTQRIWLNLSVQALAELAACYNHTGAVGPQKEAESKLTALLAYYKGDSGLDALERRTFVLDVRNRNLNLFFNDFRFDEAYSLAEELVLARKTMVGEEETDELLGQMLGSQGQACAFMGRIEPSWNSHALALFEESLRHFAPGSRQEQMSQSFKVNVLWQAGQFRDAARKLPVTQGWSLHDDNVLPNICQRLLLPHADRRAFDVVNCLRIVAGLIHVGDVCDDLVTVVKFLEAFAQRNGTDHPYELWWKWIGVLHLFNGDATAADRCFYEAQKICSGHSFTMKTIGMSITPLRIVVATMLDKKIDAQELICDYTSTMKELRKQSMGFNAYMGEIAAKVTKGASVLSARPGSAAFWSLCTQLPFAYA